MALGFYVHGGMSGVTKAVVNHSALARYLNAFLNPDPWADLFIRGALQCL